MYFSTYQKKVARVDVYWVLGLFLGNSKEITTDTLLSEYYLNLKVIFE